MQPLVVVVLDEASEGLHPRSPFAVHPVGTVPPLKRERRCGRLEPSWLPPCTWACDCLGRFSSPVTSSTLRCVGFAPPGERLAQTLPVDHRDRQPGSCRSLAGSCSYSRILDEASEGLHPRSPFAVHPVGTEPPLKRERRCGRLEPSWLPPCTWACDCLGRFSSPVTSSTLRCVGFAPPGERLAQTLPVDHRDRQPGSRAERACTRTCRGRLVPRSAKWGRLVPRFPPGGGLFAFDPAHADPPRSVPDEARVSELDGRVLRRIRWSAPRPPTRSPPSRRLFLPRVSLLLECRFPARAEPRG